ncbi:MAG: transcriptional regulator TbsP [Halapricum sp.]
MVSQNLLESDIENILQTALTSADDLVVVNPSPTTIRELVSSMDGLEEVPAVNVLADERALKDVMDDFLVASSAADLVADDVLSLRVLDDDPVNSLLVSKESVISIVKAGDQVAGLTTTDEQFVEQAYNHYNGLWEDAETFSLRTPPLSTVRETLMSDIGEGAATDFDAVLDSLQTARGDGDGLDEVTISLLVAAKNGELLYDISKWGEDIGLASKATFSRTKTQLEDMGLIDTEKVPIDVGRPRLRLRLGDDRLNAAEADELASVAQSLIAS